MTNVKTKTKSDEKPKKTPIKKVAIETKKTITKSAEKPVAKKTTPKKATLSNKLVVIETGGKQYLLSPDMEVKIEKIEKPKKGNIVKFDKVLLIVDEKGTKIGKPYISGATVEAEWVEEGRAKKITILRYKSKTRERRKKGHRQHYTKVKIK